MAVPKAWSLPRIFLIEISKSMTRACFLSSAHLYEWVHTSAARGWTRCPACRQPLHPSERKHTHKNYDATVAQRVEPRFRKSEEAVQVSPVAPYTQEVQP